MKRARCAVGPRHARWDAVEPPRRTVRRPCHASVNAPAAGAPCRGTKPGRPYGPPHGPSHDRRLGLWRSPGAHRAHRAHTEGTEGAPRVHRAYTEGAPCARRGQHSGAAAG
ncbi:hypothetical protein SSP531S_49380 [Streptomyces spongiicola]|uniref:Uncharacterized protein n=1 Tax=Streptomyces spongiicola TaxID=1690221 RepID=A0A388T3E9_9ACTN|nr:hypothetical protein SSP531S_49380 [Streptomyces spongiicola]